MQVPDAEQRALSEAMTDVFLHSAWGRLEPEIRTSLATEKFRCLLVRAGVELALPWKRN